MWKWDQGRLDYYQFDVLRKIAKFAVTRNIRHSTRAELVPAIGLQFLPEHYEQPWRNYSRVFRLAMLVVPDGRNGTQVTEIGKRLAIDGEITNDEYFHFLARCTTDPSPALSEWDHSVRHRYPLLFVLRLLLARASQGNFTTRIGRVIGAYTTSRFCGDEDLPRFLELVKGDALVSRDGRVSAERIDDRQASESIKVLAQISYLAIIGGRITVSLAATDAEALFRELIPVDGNRMADSAAEILRLAALLPDAIDDIELDYRSTLMSNEQEAGFLEGGRMKRFHLTLERNAGIRRAFFHTNPGSVCDFCSVDTGRQYPWTSKLLDVHHVLPLCSGVRTGLSGTILSDLVANCPTCHRAVHRYYDVWLKENGRTDFEDRAEARMVYEQAKQKYLETV